MRRTESEVKNELLKRKELYVFRKKQLTKRIVAAVVCVALLLAPVVTVLLLPDGGEDNGGIAPHSSAVIFGDTSSKPVYNSSQEESEAESVVSKDDGAQNSEEAVGGEWSNDGYAASSEDGSEAGIETSENGDAMSEGSKDAADDASGDIIDGTVGEQDPPLWENIKPEYEYNLIHPTTSSDGSSFDLKVVLSSCSVDKNVTQNPFPAAYSNFAATLFKGCASDGDNTLVSPLSVMLALSMLANGAEGETKEAIEKAFGGIPIEYFNKCISNYVENLTDTSSANVSISNSAWIKEGFGVNEGFLQCIYDYYESDAYMSPFTDKTVQEINAWIEENTDGLIKDMLEDLSEEAVLVLANTLLFDAEWASKFVISPDAVQRPFTNANGSTTDVYYLGDSWDDATGADVKYIETSTARGIVKKYKEGYSFVALLPNDENGLDELIASLNGNQINSMLSSAKATPISYSLPAFSFDSDLSFEVIKETLTDMGMGIAFDALSADFTNINDSGVYISQILHNASIEVNNQGTKAAAATIIVTPDGGPSATEKKQIIRFNRSFVYMIVEDSYYTPIFMGKVTDMSESDVDICFSAYEEELSSWSDYDVLGYGKADEDAVYDGEISYNPTVEYEIINSAEEFESFNTNKAPWRLEVTDINFDDYYAVAITVKESPSIYVSVDDLYYLEGKNNTTLRIELEVDGQSANGNCMIDYYYVVLVDRFYQADEVKLEIAGITE